jgi:hypothetical protein
VGPLDVVPQQLAGAAASGSPRPSAGRRARTPVQVRTAAKERRDAASARRWRAAGYMHWSMARFDISSAAPFCSRGMWLTAMAAKPVSSCRASS